MSEPLHGRALDVEVQRVVFGTTRFYDEDGHPWRNVVSNGWPYFIPSGKPWRTHAIDAVPVRCYSTDMGAAMLVLERLVEIAPHHDLHIETLGGNGWKVGTCYSEQAGWAEWYEGETLPEAICRAALLAAAATEGER